MLKKRKVIYLLIFAALLLLFSNVYSSYKKWRFKHHLSLFGPGHFDIHFYLTSSNLKSKDGPPGFNTFVSNNLEVDRELPEARNKGCSIPHGIHHLYQVSIIVAFHNEPRSTLLRTIVSVFKRTPKHLLHELILVDDFSDESEDGSLFSEVPKVKIIRNSERKGVIASRVVGSNEASGEVIVFLDSHCEVNNGWLEPLLMRLNESPKSAVTPVIDVINSETFEYMPSAAGLRGGFDWSLQFKWESIPNKLVTDQGIHPIRTPVLSAGIFAINREWFNTLGKFDDKMDIWGGENIEFSFRAWMCGGSIEIIPCSRVGHVFLHKNTNEPNGNSTRSLIRNLRRTVEVWLDQYKKLFYSSKPSAKGISYGDITQRRKIRNKLQCKTFRWYLEKVYPQLKAPVIDEVAFGQIKQSNLCLDVTTGHVPITLTLTECSLLKYSQEWSWKENGFIINNGLCLTADPNETHNYVLAKFCNYGVTQKWMRFNQMIIHESSKLCLDSHKIESGMVIAECEDLYPTQMWEVPEEVINHAKETRKEHDL